MRRSTKGLAQSRIIDRASAKYRDSGPLCTEAGTPGTASTLLDTVLTIVRKTQRLMVFPENAGVSEVRLSNAF